MFQTVAGASAQPSPRVRRGSGGDPTSGSPEQGGQPAPGSRPRYAGARHLASSSAGTSSAERPTVGANAAASQGSRPSTATPRAAASGPAQPRPCGPSAPTEDESPADAAPQPHGAAQAARRPSPARHDRERRRERAAPGSPHTAQIRTPNDHAEPSTHAGADVIEPHRLPMDDIAFRGSRVVRPVTMSLVRQPRSFRLGRRVRRQRHRGHR
jgi:hypothetical protein